MKIMKAKLEGSVSWVTDKSQSGLDAVVLPELARGEEEEEEEGRV